MAGFVFDRAGIESALKDWHALRDELCADEKVALPLAQVVGPGEEPASWGVARQAARSGASFLRHNAEMRALVDRYIAALTASRNDYLAAEAAGHDMYTGDERL